jgi:PAS domain S-box-containing protein
MLRALPGVSVIVFDRRFQVTAAGGDAVGPGRMAASECEGVPARRVLADYWAVHEPLLRGALDGRTSSIELEAEDGRRRYVVVAEPVDGAGIGKPRAGTCVWRDVTATAQLHAELEQQRRLLELAHDAVIVRDPVHSEVVYWNAAAHRIYGYNGGEARGRVTHELLRTVFPESLEATNRVLTDRGRWEGELWHTRKDGGRILVSSRQALIRDDKGQPAAVIELNSDITENRRAIDGLREAEERFRELIESAPDAMVIVDERAKIVLVNARTEELLGYRRDELIGEPVEMLVPRGLGAGHVQQRNRFLGEPRARPMGAGQDLRARRKDGTEFLADISLSPVRTGAGLLVAASIRDISKQLLHQLEKALVPRMRVGDRWQVAWRYRPSLGGMLLGGDFIGVAERTTGSLALVIGDVTGHGPSAAGTGAMLRAAWLGAVQSDVALEAIPPMLNRLLIDQAERADSPLATVCLAEVDRTASLLQLIRAGHDSPLLITHNQVRALGRGHGPLLGLHEDLTWPMQRLRLPSAGAIMLFTDGLTERRAKLDPQRIGFDQLIAQLDPITLLSHPPDRAIDEMLATVLPEGTEALDDDLAVILLALGDGNRDRRALTCTAARNTTFE